MAHLALVSFRLGGTDGVAVESAKWTAALRSLGHSVTTVAGEGEADVVLEGLSMAAPVPPSRDDLEGALRGATHALDAVRDGYVPKEAPAAKSDAT